MFDRRQNPPTGMLIAPTFICFNDQSDFPRHILSAPPEVGFKRIEMCCNVVRAPFNAICARFRPSVCFVKCQAWITRGQFLASNGKGISLSWSEDFGVCFAERSLELFSLLSQASLVGTDNAKIIAGKGDREQGNFMVLNTQVERHKACDPIDMMRH